MQLTQGLRKISASLQLPRRSNRAEAGAPNIPRQLIVRRFWQYLRFLQSHGLTTRTIAGSLADVDDSTELRSRDLTPDGLRFVRRSHTRWTHRLYIDEGAKKEDAYLKSWYEKFQDVNMAV